MEKYCKHCGVCCRYIPVDLDKNLLLWNSVQPLSKVFFAMLLPLSEEEAQSRNEFFSENVQFSNIKFFRCKYLVNQNICSNLERPSECKNFPNEPFAYIPEECGYSGFQFLKQEELKQKVRKMKEEILYYEALMESDSKDARAYKIIIDRLKKQVDKYSIFGSKDW